LEAEKSKIKFLASGDRLLAGSEHGRWYHMGETERRKTAMGSRRGGRSSLPSSPFVISLNPFMKVEAL
jgi:hypothetical protein